MNRICLVMGLCLGLCFPAMAPVHAKVIHRCHMCGMDAAKSQTEFIASLSDGSEEHICCLHCVYLLQHFFMKDRTILKLETRDFKNGGLIPAAKAFYLEGSSVIPKDSMAPFLLAFAEKKTAEKYQKKYGGNIVDLAKATEIVALFDEDIAASSQKKPV